MLFVDISERNLKKGTCYIQLIILLIAKKQWSTLHTDCSILKKLLLLSVLKSRWPSPFIHQWNNIKPDIISLSVLTHLQYLHNVYIYYNYAIQLYHFMSSTSVNGKMSKFMSNLLYNTVNKMWLMSIFKPDKV